MPLAQNERIKANAAKAPIYTMTQYGLLTVPLVHGDPDSPMIDLVVSRTSGPDTYRNMPLLIHGGGPGSGAEIAPQAWKAGSVAGTGYELWGISQRGIPGDGPIRASSLKPSNPAPYILCDQSENKKPQWEIHKAGKYKNSDFSSCPCAMPDGAPAIGETWVNIDPMDEGAVKNYFRSMQQFSQRCYLSDKFQIHVRKTGKSYNFLDYVGTNTLAADLDLLRKAIGAEKMSFFGVSYGTAVSSVYAGRFPQNTGKVVISGNMGNGMHLKDFAWSNADGVRGCLDKLLHMCSPSGEGRSCAGGQLKDAVAAYDQILDDIRDKKLTAPTVHGAAFALTVGLLGGALQHHFAAVEGWTSASQMLAALSSDDDKVRETAVGDILNELCHIVITDETGAPVEMLATWHYGLCVAQSSVGAGMETGAYLEQGAVLGVDVAGRMSLASAMKLYQVVKLQETEVALNSFLGLFGRLFDWPAPQDPTTLGNRADVPAFIVSSLFDPATNFGWTMQMRKAFPSGSMVTWAGIGHGLVAGVRWNNETNQEAGSVECMELAHKYLVTGELPVDGHICRASEDIPVRRRLADEL